MPSESSRGTASDKAGVMPHFSPFWMAIPRPYYIWVMLGIISFVAVFAWRFVEPQFHLFSAFLVPLLSADRKSLISPI
jgi:hypothetical protein